MNNYILGIDLGITSVGFGIVNKDTLEIVKYGVRLFEEGTADNNLTRRTKRGQRRLKRRKNNRILEMKRLIFKNIINRENFCILSNVYEIRSKGLKEKLSPNELANALLHIAKKRGTSLEVAIDSEDKEGQKLYGSLTENSKILKQKNIYICEMQLSKLQNEGRVKGHDNIFRTDDYIKEVEKILSNQELSPEINEKIVELISRRRHFSDGPGDENSPTPYGRFKGEIDENGNKIIHNLIDDMRGKCSIYPDEYRMAKMSFSCCLFNLLNDLNNLTIIEGENKRKITTEEKKEIIDKLRKKGNISFTDICKVLKVKIENITGYRKDKKDKPEITKFEGYSKFVKVFNETNDEDVKNPLFVDEAVDILTKTQVVDERSEAIQKIIEINNFELSKESIEKVCNFTRINGYHSLSKKAILELNDEMICDSLNQQQIITSKNIGNKISFSGKKNIQFNDSLILSPVAKRAHREAIKVINELRELYGEFDSIIIETTRSKNSADERKEITARQSYNEDQKKEAISLAGEYDLAIEKLNGIKKLKLRLYNEQNCKCIYTGNPIDLNVLLNDDQAYQIEHIIPYAISFDNSLKNKALAEVTANQLKGRNTPYYYFKSGRAYGKITSFEAFKEFVYSLKISEEKKKNLTTEENYSKFTNMNEFVNRNLIDTSYAVKSMMETIKGYYDDNNIPTKVKTVKGKLTSTFRGVGKIDENGEKDRNFNIHHAIDALIIAALSTNKAISKAYDISNPSYDDKTGEIIENPLEDAKIRTFLNELRTINKNNDIKTKPFLFSYKVDTKVGRQISDETIYSTRKIDGTDYVIKKYKNIYGDGGEKLTKCFEKNEQSKLLMAKNDLNTFEIFQKIYSDYKDATDKKGKKIKNVFAYYYELSGEKIRKYSKKNNGPIVEDVKYQEDSLNNHINITPSNAKNKKVVLLQISPYRTDFYRNNQGQYKFLTIRRYHTQFKNGKICIPNEIYEEQMKQKGIDQSYEFLFSMNRNNVIMIEDEKGKNFYRFIGTNNDGKNMIECKYLYGATIKEDTNKSFQLIISLGKKIKLIEKYNVSPTGIFSKVSKENLKLEY